MEQARGEGHHVLPAGAAAQEERKQFAVGQGERPQPQQALLRALGDCELTEAAGGIGGVRSGTGRHTASLIKAK